MLYREIDNLFSVGIEDGVPQHKDCISTSFDCGSERGLNILGIQDVQVAEIDLEVSCGEHRLS